VRYLAHRARTIAEVRKLLRSRGCGASAITSVIARLTGQGYLDDRGYVERYVASTASSRPSGRRRLEQDLLRRGVTRSILDEVLARSFGEREEAAALDVALAKAMKGTRGPLDDAARRRIAARLMRRGFRPDRVMRALAAGEAAASRDIEEDWHEREEGGVDDGQ
jgi:regulatory protein